MTDPIPKTFLNILFISGQADAIHEIETHLKSSDKLDYHVEHRPDFFGCADLLEEGESDVDVILLDMELFGSLRSREIFQRMLRIAHGIPIIVYTADKDQEMAELAIVDGAAGSITRGEFGDDIFKLHDIVEFAAARAHDNEDPKSFADRMNQRGRDRLIKAVENISHSLTQADLKNAILILPDTKV